MRPDPPFYIGTTRPSSVGRIRIGITLGAGALLIGLMVAQMKQLVLLPVLGLGAIFAGLALWTWMGQRTRFIVDEHGLTVSLGGFWPRPVWPVHDFRTVQLRSIPAETVGVTVGGYGWRRGKALASKPEELRSVGGRKIFTTGQTHQPYRLLVTRGGTMVEIIGRGDTSYLISPEDPAATAAAIDQAIRARR